MYFNDVVGRAQAYDAPEAATDDLAGKAAQVAPDLPDGPAAPPSLEQVESANPPAASAGHGISAAGTDSGDVVGEADDVQLEGPSLKDEVGTGLTGGPIGN